MTLYDDLGVAPTATPNEIKRAHRRKASKSHPDRGGDKDEFKKVQAAFGVLSNPQKRIRYDQFGTTDPTPDETKAAGYFTQLVTAFGMADTKFFDAIRAEIKKTMHKIETDVAAMGKEISKMEKRLAAIKKQNEATPNRTGLQLTIDLFERRIGTETERRKQANHEKEILFLVEKLFADLKFVPDIQHVDNRGTWITSEQMQDMMQQASTGSGWNWRTTGG